MHGEFRHALELNAGVSVLLPVLVAAVGLGFRR
jgi:uncharacterized protein (TIGR03382 family)